MNKMGVGITSVVLLLLFILMCFYLYFMYIIHQKVTEAMKGIEELEESRELRLYMGVARLRLYLENHRVQNARDVTSLCPQNKLDKNKQHARRSPSQGICDFCFLFCVIFIDFVQFLYFFEIPNTNMPSCAVATCSNTHRNKTSRVTNKIFHLHKFPMGEVGNKWIVACKRLDVINPSNARICSDHFRDEDFERNLKAELLGLTVIPKLRPDAVPSLLMPTYKRKTPCSTDRDERHAKRQRKLLAKEVLKRDEVSKIDVFLPENTVSLSEPEVDRQFISTDAQKLRRLETKLEEANKHCTHLAASLKATNRQLSQLKQKYRINQNGQLLKLRAYEAKLQALQKLLQTQKTQKALQEVFSPTQMRRLAGKRVKWNLDDIRKGLAVLSVSRKAYKIIRSSWNLPIPSERSLRSWLHKYEILPGCIDPIFELFSELTKGMSEMEKICIVSFDEMSISSGVDWDKSTDTVFGSHSKAQVALVSGICSRWRQPIFYDFDTKMTKDLLFKIIDKLVTAGLCVKAVVSDLGGTNQQLFKDLKLTPDNPKFVFEHKNQNQSTFTDIHVFADIPHMIKLIRNHLVDTGWDINGTKITKDTVQEMILKDCGEIRLCPKLTLAGLHYTGAERMKVAPAAQMLSWHTAELANKVYPNAPQIANFFRTIDSFFDIFNSNKPVDNDKVVKSGFGMKIREQNQKLEEARNIIQDMRCLSNNRGIIGTKKTLLPCQKGILMSISSLKNLYEDLKSNHGVTYILTRRLNQDPLESFFSVIRGLGRTNDNPLPSSFNNRMKILLFGSRLKPPASSNVEFHEDHVSFATSRLIEIVTSYESQPNSTHPNDETCRLLEQEITEDTTSNNIDEQLYKKEFDEEALFYLAGYIASAMKRKFQITLGEITRTAVNLQTANSNWLLSLSRGGLMIPSHSLHEAIKRLEYTFNTTFPFEKLVNVPKITTVVGNVLKQTHSDIQEKIISEYVRVRIKIRIKFINNKIKCRRYNMGKSRKNTRKVKQFLSSNNGKNE